MKLVNHFLLAHRFGDELDLRGVLEFLEGEERSCREVKVFLHIFISHIERHIAEGTLLKETSEIFESTLNLPLLELIECEEADWMVLVLEPCQGRVELVESFSMMAGVPLFIRVIVLLTQLQSHAAGWLKVDELF